MIFWQQFPELHRRFEMKPIPMICAITCKYWATLNGTNQV